MTVTSSCWAPEPGRPWSGPPQLLPGPPSGQPTNPVPSPSPSCRAVSVCHLSLWRRHPSLPGRFCSHASVSSGCPDLGSSDGHCHPCSPRPAPSQMGPHRSPLASKLSLFLPALSPLALVTWLVSLSSWVLTADPPQECFLTCMARDHHLSWEH